MNAIPVQDPLVRRAIENAQAQHCYQLKRLQMVMETIARLAQAGFVVQGFEAKYLDTVKVYVETPPDELVDGRQVNGIFRGGREAFLAVARGETERTAQMWFWIDGVRVQWDALADPLPQGGHA